jgi:hypothetical protein
VARVSPGFSMALMFAHVPALSFEEHAPLRIGIWDAFLALLRPGAEPEALARALQAYTRSTGYFWPAPGRMRCAMTWMGEPWSRSVRSTARAL